jgi:hypothetical protein
MATKQEHVQPPAAAAPAARGVPQPAKPARGSSLQAICVMMMNALNIHVLLHVTIRATQ